jgi:fumarate reductase subunit D
MNAIVNGVRSRSTVLTGAAGLLLLMTAFVMMVCAAPRMHQARHELVVHQQLSSWVWVTRGHSVPGPLARIPNEVRP